MSKTSRIKEALEVARTLGGFHGDRHRAYAIDQMVRALTGCPMETAEAIDCNGKPYTYERRGESKRYKRFVAVACAGDEGANTYGWDEGTPP